MAKKKFISGGKIYEENTKTKLVIVGGQVLEVTAGPTLTLPTQTAILTTTATVGCTTDTA